MAIKNSDAVVSTGTFETNSSPAEYVQLAQASNVTATDGQPAPEGAAPADGQPAPEGVAPADDKTNQY